MRKKNLKVFIFPAILYILTATVCLGLYWIYSDSVTVNVQEYSLTLSPTTQTLVKNHYANFTARLTLNGAAVSGKTIHLLRNGGATGISGITNSTGHCYLQWNATIIGSNQQFTVGFEVP